MNKRSPKPLILLITYLVTLALNALSSTGTITAHTQKELSDKYQTLITPTPGAFAIWSVIYLLLGLIILTALISKTHQKSDLFQKSFPFLMLALICNNIWTMTFTNDMIGISCLAIISYLISLLILNQVTASNPNFFYKLAFGLHSGWLLVATVVNLAVYLEKINFHYPLSQSLVAIIVLAVTTIIGYALSLSAKNPLFLLPMAWAWFFAFLNHYNGFYNGKYPLVGIVAFLGTILVLLLIIYSTYRLIKKARQSELD